MAELHFDIEKQNIPAPTEFANAINSANDVDELMRNISNTEIFQESGAPLYNTINMLAMLSAGVPFEPRKIGLSRYLGNPDLDDYHDTYQTAEGMWDTEMLLYDIEDDTVRENMTTLVNNLADKTELFLRHLQEYNLKNVLGFNPAIRDKLRQIFGFDEE